MLILVLSACVTAGCDNRATDQRLSDATIPGIDSAQATTNGSQDRVSTDVPDVYSLVGYFLVGGISETEKYGLIESHVADCMNDAGWEYFPQDPQDIVIGEEPIAFSARLPWRQQFGYGYAPLVPDSVGARTDKNEDYRRGLSSSAQSSYDAALGSTESESGCQFAAISAVLEESAEFRVSDRDAISDVIGRLESDTRYQGAMSMWSACMKASGYDFSHQDLARSYYSQQYAQAGSSEAQKRLAPNEIAAAEADWHCDNLELHEVRLTVEIEIINSMVESGRLPSSWLLPPELNTAAG